MIIGAIAGVTAKILSVQVLGMAACFLWPFPLAFVLFKLVDIPMGLRVSKEEELEGLDAVEHSENAFPDVTTINHGTIGTTSVPGGPGYSAAPAACSKGLPELSWIQA